MYIFISRSIDSKRSIHRVTCAHTHVPLRERTSMDAWWSVKRREEKRSPKPRPHHHQRPRPTTTALSPEWNTHAPHATLTRTSSTCLLAWPTASLSFSLVCVARSLGTRVIPYHAHAHFLATVTVRDRSNRPRSFGSFESRFITALLLLLLLRIGSAQLVTGQHPELNSTQLNSTLNYTANGHMALEELAGGTGHWNSRVLETSKNQRRRGDAHTHVEPNGQ